MRASLSRLNRQFTICIAAMTVCMAPVCGTIYGQSDSNKSDGYFVADQDVVKGQVEQWLNSAKQAMQEKKFDMAQQAISNAEKLAKQLGANVSLAYTPAQARADLAKLQSAAAPKSNPMSQILAARQYLAVGNIEKAAEMVEMAKKSNHKFDPSGDTPQRISRLIAEHKRLTELAKSKTDDDTYNSQTARFLVHQARVLMQYKDFKTAKSLAELASTFQTTYKTGEVTPAQLLTSISKHVGSSSVNVSAIKKEAVSLIAQAQFALDKGEVDKARQLTKQAMALKVPDSAFKAGETTPWELELKVRQSSRRVTSNVQPAAATMPNNKSNSVVTADYDSSKDKSHIAKVGFNQTNDNNQDETGSTVDPRGEQMFQNALAAVKQNDMKQAKEYFEMAWQYKDSLSPETRQAVQDNLSKLNRPQTQQPANQFKAPTPAVQPASNQEVIGNGQDDLYKQLHQKVMRERIVAEQMLNRKNPRGALQHLNTLRLEVEASRLAETSKAPLMRIISRDLTEMEKYIRQNLPQIESDERNRSRMQQVTRNRQQRYDNELQIQQLIETFNKLVHESRFAEAEVIARQASEIDSENEAVVVLVQKAKMLRRMAENNQLRDMKERGFWLAMDSADRAGIPFDDRQALRFSDDWKDLRDRRVGFGSGRYETASEAKIWNTLKNQKFQGTFTNEPLADVMSRLSQASGVNIFFDAQALETERVTTDRTISKDIRTPISIESVLNVVLGDVGLVFIVEDEAIKVTNRDSKNKRTKSKTYYVGDLVMPVPNFSDAMTMNFITPFTNAGGAGNIGAGMGGNGVPLTMPSNNNQPDNLVSHLAMAQQLPASPLGGTNFGGGSLGPATGMPMYNQMGGPRLGGITAADFTELISLIENTIAPDSWESTEGLGTIRAFPSTLSLIVNQTQEVHDQIQDLLEKLRELNDVQIVVEVRFITLQDDFFERIGIDFDFRINDSTGLDPNNLQDETVPSAIIGRNNDPSQFLPTGDLDIPFVQNSSGTAFGFATGNPDLGAAASLGFAILSDIEVFFLIQAVKGDQRTNVTQAPVVTMFNGQVASVNDGATRPFVTSVSPVVGDFAVAHQPIITLLPEGSFLNVQAVASANRRFIKMTLVPFFSQIQAVDTFTFNGTQTTRTNSLTDREDQDNDNILERILNDNDTETINTGTTVQLPTVAFTTVNTTVSVPDGGTILLGGVKRLSEGRVERGVPFLSNIPFANRLFKNVGIGRETQSLMLMVTPRIIIQEEEELLQVGDLGSQ